MGVAGSGVPAPREAVQRRLQRLETLVLAVVGQRYQVKLVG